jgi:hypothetical protein
MFDQPMSRNLTIAQDLFDHPVGVMSLLVREAIDGETASLKESALDMLESLSRPTLNTKPMFCYPGVTSLLLCAIEAGETVLIKVTYI